MADFYYSKSTITGASSSSSSSPSLSATFQSNLLIIKYLSFVYRETNLSSDPGIFLCKVYIKCQ